MNTIAPTNSIYQISPASNSQRKGTNTGNAERVFCLEALAPCLADLKLQIALRQAMP